MKNRIMIWSTVVLSVGLWLGGFFWLSTRFDLWPATVVEPGAEVPVRPVGTFQ